MMKRLLVTMSLCCALFSCAVFAQNTNTTSDNNAGKEPRVALGEQATAFDTMGNITLGGRLRTTTLNGTPDAPIRNARFVIENRSANAYTFVSGVITFYDPTGVRCGQGVWNLDALAATEAAEIDAPDLRVTCAATTWRIVATSLITRGGTDVAKPNANNTAPAQASPSTTPSPPPTPAPPPPSKPSAKPPTTQSLSDVSSVRSSENISGDEH